jgi:hypothetical protein
VRKSILSAVGALLLLAGCIHTGDTPEGPSASPQSAEQTLFAAQTGYNAALATLVFYETLPRCTEEQGDVEPAARICSDPDVVKKIRVSENAAYATLEAAKGVVLSDGGFSEETALNHAEAAQKIVESLDDLILEFGISLTGS